MNGRRILEALLLGGCAFVLSTAVVSLIMGDPDLTEGDPLWRLILSISYLGAALLLLPYYREALYVLRRNWFLLVLVALAFLSTLWTEMPVLTLRRSIAVSGATLFGVALAVRLSLEDQLRFLSWLFRIIAVLSLACIVFLPSYGISDLARHEWRGVFAYKNVFGSVMALSVLVEWQLPVYTRFSRILNCLALILSGVLLFFSNAITPLVALAGSFLFIQTYKVTTQRLRIPRYAAALAILLMVSVGMMIFTANSETIAGALGRSSHLTGRTDIWDLVAPLILDRPIVGYGYSGFWFGASAASTAVNRAIGTTIMYSHNGYLEMLLNLGAVGFVLALVFLGTGLKRAYSWSEHRESPTGLWPLAFLLFFILYNFGECTILLQDLQWSICVAVVASTDSVLFAPDAEGEDEMLLEPREEFA